MLLNANAIKNLDRASGKRFPRTDRAPLLSSRTVALMATMLSCLLLSACQVVYDESFRLPGTGQEPAYAGVGQSDYESVQYLADSASTMAQQASQAAAEASMATATPEGVDAASRAASAAEAASASAAEAASAARMMKTMATTPPPPPPARNFLGIRFDRNAAKARQERANCPPVDPCTVPSYSELRKAKADAQMTAEIKAQKGDTQIKPDGSSSNPTEVKFVSSPGALGINLIAEANLNAFDGTPHALVLNIFHLEDRTFFDQLASTSEGIRKLLGRDVVDPSIKSIRQLFIQPGTHSTMSIERSENGRYVALVAGFDRMDPSRSVYVSTYGIGHYKKKAGALAKSQDMFSPLPLNLAVHLGADGMTVSQTEELFDNLALSKEIPGPVPATTSSAMTTYDIGRYEQPFQSYDVCAPMPVVTMPMQDYVDCP